MKRGFLVFVLSGTMLTISGVALAATTPSNQASITQCVQVQYHDLSIPLQAGDLIMISQNATSTRGLDPKAIYFYASNKERYLFPNANVFFSWCENFSQVKTISADDMASLPVGGVVTYRPGSKLIKFPSSPRVYLVTRGGVLRWVTTPAVAVGLYGPLWSKMIDDVPDVFAKPYQFGPPVKTPTELSLMDVVASTGNSIEANLDLTK